MTELWRYFADLFCYVLLFEDRLRVGEHPVYDDVRRVCRTIYHQQKEIAADQGHEDAFYQAGFAVVAWVDETILKARTDDDCPWDAAEQWSHFSLQHELYDIANAGEEFFPRLKQLQPEQNEIREVYYLCLALGYGGPRDEDELAIIRQKVAEQLPCHIEDLRQTEYVVRQPYEERHDIVPNHPNGRGRALLLGTGLIVLTLLIISPMAMSSLLKPQIDAAQVVDILRKDGLLNCTNVTAVSQQQNGDFVLEGRVQDHAQRMAITERVKAIRGVDAVTDSFEMMPRPFCDALQLVEPFLDSKRELTIEDLSSLMIGDKLEVRGLTPSFPSYLYALNINAQHDGWQIFPNGWDAQLLQPSSPHTPYLIGQGQVAWKITKPAGRGMIILLASRDRLPVLDQIEKQRVAEPSESFLQRISEALRGKADRDLVVSYLLIETRDR